METLLLEATERLGAARSWADVGQALRDLLVPRVASACWLDLGEGWADAAPPEAHEWKVPLRCRGEPLGILHVAAHPALDPARVGTLLTLLADRAGAELGLLAGPGAPEADSVLERAVEARTLQFFRASSELAARNRALEAFAALSRELATETDERRLVTRAQERLLALLPEGVSAYLEPEGDLWRLRSLVGDPRSEALRETLERGVPRGALATLERAFAEGKAAFEGVVPDRHGDPAHPLAHVGALAVLPLSVGGEARGVIAVAIFRQRTWQEADRALLVTAVRQLQTGLERSEALAQVARQHAQLEARAGELADLNRELEAFSYSVSHDLRAPLRHIAGFADLARGLPPGPDGRLERYLDHIATAAARMSALIESLLTHARLGRQEVRRVNVDLAALVQGVRLELAPDEEGRQVTWQVGALPGVPGDPGLLRLVLQNLLSNALKYTRGREHAVISVTAEVTGDEVLLAVSDNGAGFDPQYADRLFTPFGRLHRQEDFEGTGVGLANVRRIVTRHGGRVWAEGRPGEGATFFVAFPLG